MKDGLIHAAKLSLQGKTLNVLLYLLGHADPDGLVHVSQAQIANELGMQRTHVSRSIKELEEHDLIKKSVKDGTKWIFKINDMFIG